LVRKSSGWRRVVSNLGEGPDVALSGTPRRQSYSQAA
jgi:hypothetical protein